ncbi:hypothetical protein ACIRRH_05375 [Kitasatospora sp. NPDC101235]|uniref:hypothetical protein n=1 Tax=Kitasatospora sp. NPDC101235 TaxID=3364101 RepID=UPI0037FB5A9C
MTVTTGTPAAPARRPAPAALDLGELDGLRTVPARHPWRWAAGSSAAASSRWTPAGGRPPPCSASQVIYGRTGRVVPLLVVATVWYVVLTTLLSIGQCCVERHFARGAERTPPPTPWQRVRAFARSLPDRTRPTAARTSGGQS